MSQGTCDRDRVPDHDIVLDELGQPIFRIPDQELRAHDDEGTRKQRVLDALDRFAERARKPRERRRR